MKPKALPVKICGIYDTETTNYGSGSNAHAFTVLYQINDIRNIEITEYEAGKTDDIRFYRSESEVMAYIKELIEWGHRNDTVPVICAYNMMFDLQTMMEDISQASAMLGICARSKTNAYTIDLIVEGEDSNINRAKPQPDLRFWDTFYLEPSGLKNMGETAGLPKLLGDWDYELVRTPETPLTDKEKEYAARDVQVIPAYLRSLCKTYDWLTPDMFGRNVLTKTSIVRQMAKHTLFNLQNRRGFKAGPLFMGMCKANRPDEFGEYELQKACNRAGLTFTAAANASKIVTNVASADVTSMHHTWISARIPKNFEDVGTERLQKICEGITEETADEVLANYSQPFKWAIHAQVRFKNIRLREGSCFDHWGIATLARAKFGRILPQEFGAYALDGGENMRTIAQQKADMAAGYKDTAVAPVFAFSKLYAAKEATCFLTELELWIVSEVYEWDSMEALQGEASKVWVSPPEYVALQSHILYEQKSKIKKMLNDKDFKEGVPYNKPYIDALPAAAQEMAKNGTLEKSFLKAIYQTVKGSFNSIYGTQVQDVFRPDFEETEDGMFDIDPDTVTTAENWDERMKDPQSRLVYYAYGLRIAGRSRVHLILALELLYKSGLKFEPTGGDTDSIKFGVPEGVTDSQILDILAPLHNAADQSIARATGWMLLEYPAYASSLEDVGHFDLEWCDDEKTSKRYPYHFELWNKGRVSVDVHGNVHVTMAGLRRPKGVYTVEDYLKDKIRTDGVEKALTEGLGYNCTVAADLSYSLQRTQPKTTDTFEGMVTDWRGDTAHVYAHEAICLYKIDREIGDLESEVNAENVKYLKEKYNRDVCTTPRRFEMRRGRMDLVRLARDEGYYELRSMDKNF